MMELRNTAARLRHLRLRRTAVAVGNVLACSGLLGFIACADHGITEPGAASRGPASSRGPGPAPTTTTTTVTADTLVEVFTYVPSTGNTVSLSNGTRVVLPAGSVCDLTSGYGPVLWNSKCPPSKASVEFTIRSWVTSTGVAQMVVSPDVRFAPGKVVTLTLAAPNGTASASPVIQWCTSALTQCVDEGATDAQMKTQFDPATLLASRRIKHFSGYAIQYGRVDLGGAVTFGVTSGTGK